jgi:hypothetical protein
VAAREFALDALFGCGIEGDLHGGSIPLLPSATEGKWGVGGDGAGAVLRGDIGREG